MPPVAQVIHLRKNMPDLKSLNESLSAAARILYYAATEIRDIPLDPTKENISTIGEALTLIFKIQQQIYMNDPSLEPEYLRRTSPYPDELKRKFGKLLLRMQTFVI